MTTLQLPAWIPMLMAVLPNLAIGIVIVVFRKRIRLVAVSVVPQLSDGAELWVGRIILIVGVFLIGVASLLGIAAVSSALA